MYFEKKSHPNVSTIIIISLKKTSIWPSWLEISRRLYEVSVSCVNVENI